MFKNIFCLSLGHKWSKNNLLDYSRLQAHPQSFVTEFTESGIVPKTQGDIFIQISPTLMGAP